MKKSGPVMDLSPAFVPPPPAAKGLTRVLVGLLPWWEGGLWAFWLWRVFGRGGNVVVLLVCGQRWMMRVPAMRILVAADRNGVSSLLLLLFSFSFINFEFVFF